MAAGTPPTVDGVPPLGGAHHVGLTVCDARASEAWHRRTLGLEWVTVEAHHGGGGHAVVPTRPGTPLFIGLDHHDANQASGSTSAAPGLTTWRSPSANGSSWTAVHLDRLGVSRSDTPSAPTRSPRPCWCSAIPTTSSWS
jgi:catechol 2,3-dioxygenase-like lactoylglutathione lyase family enzyme